MMMDWNRTLLALVALLAALPARADTISGAARVVDGDSLELGGARVRLWGVDAPEARQECQRGGQASACGAEAQRQLDAMIGGAEVTCEQQDTDRYGRMVARCTADGSDLGERLVVAGLAVVLPNGAERYGAAEARARVARAGIWAGTFQRPGEWRAAHPREDAPVRVARVEPSTDKVWRRPLGCAIKGNRSLRGPWIYHLPGTLHYAETRAEEVFCTERQARAAGYRRARND